MTGVQTCALPIFASAIGVGYDMAESDLIERLAADLEALHGKLGEDKPPEAKQA